MSVCVCMIALDHINAVQYAWYLCVGVPVVSRVCTCVCCVWVYGVGRLGTGHYSMDARTLGTGLFQVEGLVECRPNNITEQYNKIKSPIHSVLHSLCTIHTSLYYDLNEHTNQHEMNSCISVMIFCVVPRFSLCFAFLHCFCSCEDTVLSVLTAIPLPSLPHSFLYRHTRFMAAL